MNFFSGIKVNVQLIQYIIGVKNENCNKVYAYLPAKWPKFGVFNEFCWILLAIILCRICPRILYITTKSRVPGLF